MMMMTRRNHIIRLRPLQHKELWWRICWHWGRQCRPPSTARLPFAEQWICCARFACNSAATPACLHFSASPCSTGTATTTTDYGSPSSSNNTPQCPPPQSPSSSENIELPEQIGQRCAEWKEMLLAEWEAVKWQTRNWVQCRLAFRNATTLVYRTNLELDKSQLTRDKKNVLATRMRLGYPVELRQWKKTQLNSEEATTENVLIGEVKRQDEEKITIFLDRKLSPEEEKEIEGAFFDIREAVPFKSYCHHIDFLRELPAKCGQMAGYGAMLAAYKCVPLPDSGAEPLAWSNDRNLDPSQLLALRTVLNPRRPIVAVHGPPGSGKTRLLVEYLHLLAKQAKRALVISHTQSGLYHLLGEYCKKISTEKDDGNNFLCLKMFDQTLMSKIVVDPAIQALIDERSVEKCLKKRRSVKAAELFEKAKRIDIILAEMGRSDAISKERREAGEELRLRCIGRARQLEGAVEKELMDEQAIIFTAFSFTRLKQLMQRGITFDVVILDRAETFNEFESWLAILPTAPIVRLFGDYDQSEIPTRSPITRQSALNKSLLHYLDVQFGGEVNVHLGRQYRSNAAILEWPNRVFYRERAAENDERVKNIQLGDLMVAGQRKPRNLFLDPLLMIDLGKLEGEWREWMLDPVRNTRSWFNWGEAFLVSGHLRLLFENVPHCRQIAYIVQKEEQRNKVNHIFSAIFPEFLQQFGHKVRIEHGQCFQGQQLEVVLYSRVIKPGPEEFSETFHLKHLAFEMSRARRQFVCLADSAWLESGSTESRLLLDTFRERGRIIGPNELVPLEPGQFHEIQLQISDWYARHGLAFREEAMRWWKDK